MIWQMWTRGEIETSTVFFQPDLIQSIRFLMPLRGVDNGVRNQFYSFQYTYIYGIVMAVGGQVPFSDESYQRSWVLKELEVYGGKQRLKSFDFFFSFQRAAALRNDPRSQVSWIVVWVHTPMYSSSNGHAGGNAELRKSFEKLFVDFKVRDMGFPLWISELTFPKGFTHLCW
jgi:hypothetical protein